MKRQKTLEDRLYVVGWIFLLAGSIGIFIYLQLLLPNVPSPPCVFFHILGIYCPGCGGTRALNALLHGRLLLSLWYHPLVLYTVVIFGGFMLTQTMERIHIKGVKGWKFHNWHMYAAVVILAANWGIKNFLLHFCNVIM